MQSLESTRTWFTPNITCIPPAKPDALGSPVRPVVPPPTRPRGPKAVDPHDGSRGPRAEPGSRRATKVYGCHGPRCRFAGPSRQDGGRSGVVVTAGMRWHEVEWSEDQQEHG